MGFFRRKQPNKSTQQSSPVPRSDTAKQEPLTPFNSTTRPPVLGADPIQITGTTTIGADNANKLFRDRRLPTGGMLETRGFLQREPNNPVDEFAVAVLVDGVRIGYLPGPLARGIALTPGEQHPCRTQLWAEPFQGSLRVVGWVADGDQAPKWPHSPGNPPAITPQDQRAQRQEAVSSMVSEALQGSDRARAAQFQAGMVNGRHYLELIEPIKDLKRQGRLEEALELAYQAIQGAEQDRDGREPAPGYTIEAAIILRKLGRRDEEIAVLERWLALCPKNQRASSKAFERLSKITGK